MERKWEEIFFYLSQRSFPEEFRKSQRQNLRRYATKFTLKEGELYFGNRKVVKTKEEAKELFKEFHISPTGFHMGIVKTRSAMCTKFYWHGISVDVDKWVAECDNCQRVGRPLTYGQKRKYVKRSLGLKFMMAQSILLEVCVDSVESAVNAERGGAGRLELCSSLMEGGLTPSLGLLQVVKQYIKIPVYVMIRPRGGDFLYSDQEVEVMKKDIELMKMQGADGVVVGALTETGGVDAGLCMELIAAARPLPLTFHRAFDMAFDPAVALETLISLGFERVLTSGCDSSALEGLPVIKRLIDQAKGRIIVMPGGGITERNLQRILEGSGAEEFHCSARSSRDSAMKFRNSCVTMGATISAPEYGLKVADASKVRSLNAIAKNTL
ncbi:copper homeostasis protein cutC homolog isoform X1 [Poecilia reticulata]|nr:PREDICTED: copper homeostasis protein cutC homolog isoform X1 [Poecilia reticulata]XP_008427890.1 PREDICTED: copper homeostasis protein cutC homolog isoform X1 [Poecilia reticulata]